MMMMKPNLEANTKRAAQKAFRKNMIDGKTLVRLTDGTVSSLDIKEAKRLLSEYRERAGLMRDNKDDYSSSQIKTAQDRVTDATWLLNAVKNQYADQGYVESGAEYAGDWKGGGWKRPAR